jgi:hypothetical protein
VVRVAAAHNGSSDQRAAEEFQRVGRAETMGAEAMETMKAVKS